MGCGLRGSRRARLPKLLPVHWACAEARIHARLRHVGRIVPMTGEELGPWDPMRPDEAASQFGTWAMPWWVAGGWAIDLLLGRQSRDHGHLDVLVLRRDQALVREYLRGWDVHAAINPPGRLRPWPIGETLPPTVHDVWCRPTHASAWTFQLMIDDTDGDDWLFRRD